MEVPIGVQWMSITGTSLLVEASCAMRVWVKEARISVQPPTLEVECLSTAFADTNIAIANEGDDPVEIFDIALSDTWANVVGIMDDDGVEVTLPAVFVSQQTFTATVRTEGTAVPAGPHVTNGTVFSSNGEDFFNVKF